MVVIPNEVRDLDVLAECQSCHFERSEKSMLAENCYYVYLLTRNNKVMYVGVTNDLTRRVYEHQNKL